MSSEPAGITSECQPMRGNDHDSSTASDIGSDMESPMTSPPRATPGGPSSRSVGFKVPSLAFGRPGLSMDAHNSNPSTRTSLAGRYESGAVSNDASSGLNYAVELLSPAFGIVQETSPLDPKYLRQECASKLGVIEDRLRLYALVPVDVNNSNKLGPHEPFRIAMEVQNSDFSLRAIEDVLAENHRLSTHAAAEESTILSLQKEIARLRQHLKSSELLRHRGQQALQELKEEFETLHFDLMQHTDTVLSARGPGTR